MRMTTAHIRFSLHLTDSHRHRCVTAPPRHPRADSQGRIRHHHYGEGEYQRSEMVIQQLLAEAGTTG
jgi:hypothetical protein